MDIEQRLYVVYDGATASLHSHLGVKLYNAVGHAKLPLQIGRTHKMDKFRKYTIINNQRIILVGTLIPPPGQLILPALPLGATAFNLLRAIFLWLVSISV